MYRQLCSRDAMYSVSTTGLRLAEIASLQLAGLSQLLCLNSF